MSEMSDFFDAKAAGWDSNQGNYEMPAPVIDQLGQWAQGARVLDVGCGTGIMESYLLEAGAASIVATDVSSEMIACAKEKFAAYPQVRYECQDVLELAVEDGSFDLVLMYNVYPHLMDKAGLVAKVSRLLKPGSHFLVAHGSSRHDINHHHATVPSTITSHLNTPQEEGIIWLESGNFSLDVMDDGDFYYLLGGTRL